MKTFYDKIFITNQPSFYKVNLYNEIAKKKRILVLFTNHLESERNKDFTSASTLFDNQNIFGNSVISKTIHLIKILNTLKYNELIVSGWDNVPTWIIVFLKNKKKNSCVSESSYHESTTRGIKGLFKRIFLSRISLMYVSGKAQKKVIDELGFKGSCRITNGVGVFNYIKQPEYKPRSAIRNFIFVGRLIPVKNLHFIINYFNSHPDLQLYIVGFGNLEQELKAISNKNIKFLGPVDNKKLPPLYQSMDVFILPSKSEAWGLVVEEALNNGLPVLVSNKVGCAEEIVNESNGLVFEYNSETSLDECVKKITEVKFYNKLRYNISKIDFSKIELDQISQYLN